LNRWRLGSLLVLSLALAGTAPQAADPPDALQLESCTLSAPGLPDTIAARCGVVEVPENRAQPSGRRIRLAVAVVPGTARRPQSDPVFMLAGGPGQAAGEAFPLAAPAFRGILRERDVVLVDQRGTGGSNPLSCKPPDDEAPADDGPAFSDGAHSEAEVAPGNDALSIGAAETASARIAAARERTRRCVSRLDADPRFYTTSDAVLDLEAVRAALGARAVNLVGISYGTRVALEYLRRHPERIRSVVLDGVVPPELALGAEHARNLETALDVQFAACAADAACARAYGSPRDALARLLEELRREPRPVRYRDPVTDESREDPLTAETVAGVVRLYAYAPQLAAMLPKSLSDAAAGRPEVLKAQARMIESLVGEQVAEGAQLSVACAEDAGRLEVEPDDADTLLGTEFVATLLAQCEVWPRGHRPVDFNEPVESERPVLLISGELDPVTPPRYGEQVLGHLPKGRHLVVRGQGHNVMATGCMPRLMARFVATADATGLDVGCLEQLGHTPPFAGAYGWEP
jgi:pimeloyl-ACP methyl ester carboxylesterase